MINYGESHGRFLVIYNGFICFCVALPFKVTARLPACQVRTGSCRLNCLRHSFRIPRKFQMLLLWNVKWLPKTMELEKLAREFQQSQSDLFSRVHSVSDSLLQMSRDLRVREVGEVQRLSSIPSAIPFPSQNGRHEAGNGEGASPQFASLRVDDETFEALKRRLQSLGDVVVFTSDKFDACCASGHSIPPGAVRVRPRRCDHVFLVECLMPYWVEGLCPVCRCSFAYNRDANDESDRCSSVSTSVSQRATLISHSRQAEALSKGEVREATSFREPSLGNLGFTRGPKVLQREIQTRPADRSERYKGITSSRVPSDASGFDRDRDATRVVRSPSRSGTGATGVSGSLSRTSSGRDRPL